MSPAGYKLSDVKTRQCLMCRELIGNLPYREVRILARFGQMLFEHERCPVVQLSFFDTNCG